VNKKKQKNFANRGLWHLRCHSRSESKVFWFFFSKKNVFLSSLA